MGAPSAGSSEADQLVLMRYTLAYIIIAVPADLEATHFEHKLSALVVLLGDVFPLRFSKDDRHDPPGCLAQPGAGLDHPVTATAS